MNYIINDKSIVVLHEGKPFKVDKSAPEYNRLIACFDLPEEEQDNAVNEVIQSRIGRFQVDGFDISPDEVLYHGERLPTALANKVRSISAEGLPVKLFAKFWENLQANPSANSVRQLYDFLAYKQLPITEDGCFIAYKGVERSGWSCHGNTHTKVLQGEVNDSGRIKNKVGDTIEVLRRDVDDNRNHHCSFGLHVGSLDYASSFSNGLVLIVKINPADVVSVPDDCSCQKCRVCKYEVTDSYETEIQNAVLDCNGNPILSEEDEDAKEFLNIITEFIDIQQEKGNDRVRVATIQNQFASLTEAERPNRIRVLDALNTLGYHWYQEDNSTYVDID